MAEFEMMRRELQACTDAGRSVSFWLRDDDFVGPSERFRAMAETLRRLGVRCVLSAIPARLTADELNEVDDGAFLVCQHGFAHENHAEVIAKHEFGATRPLEAALREIGEGRDIMVRRFGGRFAPLFVPPWNRIGNEIAGRLPSLGFVALSTYLDETPAPVDGLTVVDSDFDILDWPREGQGVAAMLPPGELDARIAQCLARKIVATSRPLTFGLLTHHRAMTEAAWAGLGSLVELSRDHGCVVWPDPAELFGLNAPGREKDGGKR